ncbi:hypothetical protein PRK78_004087 [Emydomyces testavorans]|uniref:Uncharacterized protein n=1 Tax=Emydomyces testavorans TaxID=2070801 RepID=A0AAF0IL87_9EURO|nr:hypothetical protein PRK78_004087 [Emydomyces testavorans]
MDPSREHMPTYQTPGTPPRPPYSPVTPVMAHTRLYPATGSESVMPPYAEQTMATGELPTSVVGFVSQSASNINREVATDVSQTLPSPVFAPEPAPVPISESDNPDAIALRSAISVLQVQKQQALRDIRALEEMKQAATESPEAFAREVISGKLTVTEGGMNLFRPQPLETDGGENSEHGDKHDMHMHVGGDQQKKRENSSVKFGQIPKPQDIVRMPPINWAKYHIVGESLDKLHEEQRRRPSAGEPRKEMLTPIQRAPEHVIAAPYRPFTDKLDSPMKTRSSNKRKNEQS